MAKPKLDKEERDILGAFESGEFKSVMTPARKKAAQAAATATMQRDRRITIPISRRDLVALQREAAREGVPCQALVSSILHNYVAGRLEDKVDS